MAYVHIAKNKGVTLTDYRTVREAMGEEPIQGQLAHLVGEADGGLVTVDVWASKADADRFAAERLFPAFEKTGTRPGPESSYTTFETDQADVAGIAEGLAR